MRTDIELKSGNMLRASQIIGERVMNATHEDLGKIEDVVIDAMEGRITYAVLSFGGFLGMGDKLFAIPFTALERDAEEGCFVLDVPRERLENAPGFPKDHWPDFATDAFETDVYEYYGRPRYR